MHSGTAEECVMCVYVCGRKRKKETDLSFLYKCGIVVLALDVLRCFTIPHGRHIHRLIHTNTYTQTHTDTCIVLPFPYLCQSQSLHHSSVTYYIPVSLHLSTVPLLSPFLFLLFGIHSHHTICSCSNNLLYMCV